MNSLLDRQGLDHVRSLVVPAVRRLTTRPGLTCTCIGILAVAIGLVTTMFAMLDSLLLRPVPFPGAEHLARVYLGNEHGGSPAVPPAVLRAWRTVDGFAAVEAAITKGGLIQTPGGEFQKTIAVVTPDIFQLLGRLTPERGRFFGPEDLDTNHIIISADLWHTYFGSDPLIIGKPVNLDRAPATIIGVLPSAVHFRTWDTQIWAASNLASDANAAGANWPVVYVRLPPGPVQSELWRQATMVARDADPSRNMLWVKAEPLAAVARDKELSRVAPLLLSATLLLFIALCANVSGLLLAGLTASVRDIELASLLGASRRRLIAESVLQSGLISITGAMGGIIVASWLLSGLRGLLSEAVRLHSLNPIDVDSRALIAASIASAATLVLSGVVPPVVVTGGTAGGLGRLLGSRVTKSRASLLLQRVLLATQIAVSVSLLLCAAVLLRSFLHLVSEPREIEVRGTLVASVAFPPQFYSSDAAVGLASRSVEEAVRKLTGVERTTWSYGTPPGGGLTWEGPFTSDNGGLATKLSADVYIVRPDYFDFYRLRVLRGRLFDLIDTGAEVVVSQRFAAAMWSGVDAIGHTFRFQNRDYRVVGVVADTRLPSLDATLDNPQIYVRLKKSPSTAMLSIRCMVDCPQPLAVTRHVTSAAANVRVQNVRLLSSAYERELARPRIIAAMATIFGICGLVAATAGLFGLMSRSVINRRREYGIRLALGASPRSIGALVCRDGLRVGLPGLIVGCLLLFWLQRTLSSLLYRAAVPDWTTVLPVLIVIAVAGICALWLPARIAARLEPTVLLRED